MAEQDASGHAVLRGQRNRKSEERLVCVFTDQDQKSELVIFMVTQGTRVMEAEVKKTDGIQTRNKFLPLSPSEIVTAMEMIKKSHLHVSERVGHYRFNDRLDSFSSFDVTADSLLELLANQLDAAKSPRKRRANGKEKVATEDMPVAHTAKDIVNGVDAFLAKLDEVLAQPLAGASPPAR